MAKRKKGKKAKKGESPTLAEILSSDAVVRVISSHVNAAIPGRIGVTGGVTVNLVDAATGQVIKTISSLAEEVLSDPALPKKDRRLLKTPKGFGDLLTLISLFLTVAIATDQKLDQRQTDQILKQIAKGLEQIEQSVEQIVPSHSKQAAPAPTPKEPSPSPSKPKTPVSSKNQKTRPNQRARKKKE